MKEKIITIAITTAVAAASFVGGWFGKKWYDHHVK